MPLKHSGKAELFAHAKSLLNLAPNSVHRILDFGCGKGEFLGQLSGVVAPDSTLIGFDAMPKSVDEARTTYPRAEFICGNFKDELPFPDASFDTVVTVDAIECVRNKGGLVREFQRVLEPNGTILAMHWDWDTQTYNIQNRELARKAISAFSDWIQPWMDEADGQMGRKLWGLFEGSGKFHGTPGTYTLVETEYEPGRYGYDRVQDLSLLVEQGGFDTEEYVQFCQELSDSVEAGEYFYSVTSFIYHGARVA